MAPPIPCSINFRYQAIIQVRYLKEKHTLEGLELARYILEQISDVKGEDIIIIDIHELTPIADFFVICSAASERQLKAIVNRISEEVRKAGGSKPLRVEGEASGGWVLLDYGDVVVHAFTPEQRRYYDLEGFWEAAKTVTRMQ
ncbi:MAG: ribosome silencing factor [Anaerolineales bacterium]